MVITKYIFHKKAYTILNNDHCFFSDALIPGLRFSFYIFEEERRIGLSSGAAVLVLDNPVVRAKNKCLVKCSNIVCNSQFSAKFCTFRSRPVLLQSGGKPKQVKAKFIRKIE